VIIKLPNNLEDPLLVQLTLISNPPRFAVDPLLEKIVGMRAGTRVEILDALWLYIKVKKLQDVENKEIINSDDHIRHVAPPPLRPSKPRS
jgi:chromatin remodeling complex protein RSC6